MATNNKKATRRLFSVIFVAFCVLNLVGTLAGQEEPKGVSIPQDWSTRHLLFTNGSSPEAAAAATRDPHFWYAWAQRNALYYRRPPVAWPRPKPTRRHSRVDWAVSLGPNGGMPIGETPGMYTVGNSGTITLANCNSDFAVFVLTAAPSSTQANIIALNNLYTGSTSSYCPNGPQTPPTTDYTAPTFLWSYAAGSNGISLSPAISLDGKKFAFIDSGNPAMFNILTWVAGQGTDSTHPATPGSSGSSLVQISYTNTTVTGCTANSSPDSNASPYVDYNTDSAYIAADNGYLYRITGVFKGTPALQYCIKVNTTKNHLMTSPIYDQVNNVVYISDGYSLYGFTPGATGFTAAGSISIASTSATDPIVLSPYLDTGNGFVYVFSAADSSNKNAIVAQVNLALTSQVTAAIGPKPTSGFMLDGDFDNAYWTTGPTAGAGTLYACGTDASGTGGNARPSLYALSFSSPNGLMNSTPVMSDNRNINDAANSAGTCSPLVDVFDGTTDRLFVGTGSYLGTNGANMVTEWNVNTRPTSTTKPNSAATGYWGGTSAFTMDNFSTEPQAASIYFGTLQPPPPLTTTPCGAGNYCAVKLTQSGLQ